MENGFTGRAPYQGVNSSKVFSGKYETETTKKIYAESAEYMANIIKERIKERGIVYTFADFGSYKGELMQEILETLSEYNFRTIGIDFEENLKENEVVQEKIPADLSKLPLKDRSIDFGIARYVLIWNSPEKQKKILSEISRVIKDFVIVQHAGSDNDNPEKWRKRLDDLFDSKEIPKLERHGHFFLRKQK